PKRIVTATVLVPSHEEGGPWRLLGWSNTSPVWEPYTQALANFRKTSYLNHGGDGRDEIARWIEASQDVQMALNELVDFELDGLPYALILDGNGTRRIWP